MRGVHSLLVACFALAGCHHHSWFSWHEPAAGIGAPAAIVGENPLVVPVTDSEFLWNQVVDTLDDYFKIEREERVRVIGGVWTAGRVDTHPVTGATLLEPWRPDSTRGFERLHSTLQSVRRRVQRGEERRMGGQGVGRV